MSNKSTKIKFGTLLTLIGLSFGACKKYEEGPGFSLRSKKERLANDWKPVKVLQDGKEVDSSMGIDYNEMELELTKDGDAEISIKVKIGNLSYDLKSEGKWEFKDKKEKLELDFEENQVDATLKILKLKEDELWLLDETTNIEMHLEPK